MAYKISFWVVLFLVFFNGGAALLADSGAAAYAGIDPATCGQDISDAAEALEEFQTGQGTGATLFGLYNALANTLQGLFNSIYVGAAMLQCAGVPTYLTAFVFGGLSFIPAYDLIKFLRSG